MNEKIKEEVKKSKDKRKGKTASIAKIDGDDKLTLGQKNAKVLQLLVKQ